MASATSTGVERVFSKGRLILAHTRNRLSAESIRALLFVGDWSRRGILNVKKMRAVLSEHLKDAATDPTILLREGWDAINL